MSKEYENQDPIDIANQAEKDLASTAAKQGAGGARGASDSTLESGVDESVTSKFPGSEVVYGSAASGAGDNREIPESEGGSVNPKTGQMSKAGDFEGAGGPEDKAEMEKQINPGSDEVRDNIRQGYKEG